MIIFSFGNIGAYKLMSNLEESKSESSGIPITELLGLHLSIIEEDQAPLIHAEIISQAIDVLLENHGLLWDYFGILIQDVNGVLLLIAIPSIIENFIPPAEALPSFIYDLYRVNFDDVSLV
jgi:hypothetical protein